MLNSIIGESGGNGGVMDEEDILRIGVLVVKFSG